MKIYKLICFDVDGTLTESWSLNLLPGVVEWFVNHPKGNQPKVAMVTNQGGIGLRYWMEQGNFGDPTRYPTEDEASERLQSLAGKLMKIADQASDDYLYHLDLNIYIAYAYQSKKGQWGPIPEGLENFICGGNGFEGNWNQDWRKPNPGMIKRAMLITGVSASGTLMVGDSEDDQKAAQAAGVDFIWADEFFGRS